MGESDKPKIWVSALICTDVLREDHGARKMLTALRISNGFQATPINLQPDPGLPGLLFATIQFKLLVTAHCEVERTFTMTSRMVAPNGRTFEDMQPMENQVILSNGSGVTTVINSSISPNLAGVYWFEIFVDGELATKVPMVILHQSQDSFLKALEQKSLSRGPLEAVVPQTKPEVQE